MRKANSHKTFCYFSKQARCFSHLSSSSLFAPCNGTRALEVRCLIWGCQHLVVWLLSVSILEVCVLCVRHALLEVSASEWPVVARLASLVIASGLVLWFKFQTAIAILLGVCLFVVVVLAWCVDILREGVRGDCIILVVDGLKIGMLLFIFREVCFFGAFFWRFFHASLIPRLLVASLWPPTSVEPFNPLQIPLLNTAVLLARGVTITWSHHLITSAEGCLVPLAFTVGLGIYFSSCMVLLSLLLQVSMGYM